MTSRCPHVTTGVRNLTAECLTQLLENATCSVCRLSSTSVNLWLCLFPNCYMMGCSTSKYDHRTGCTGPQDEYATDCSGPQDDHSTAHFNANPAHCLQLNVLTQRVWCYKCCEEVNMSRRDLKMPGVTGEEREDKTADYDETLSAPPGLVGLVNLGNTCYMNSALQCLSTIPSLTMFFLWCSEMIPKDSKPDLSQAYLELIEEMWKDSQDSGPRYLAPTDLLHAMQEVCPMFRGFQQHDAQEFLRCFMDQLHQELSEHFEEDYDDEEHSEMGEGENDSGMDDQLATVDQNEGRKRKLTDKSEAKDSGLGSVESFQDMSPTSHRKASESRVNLSDEEQDAVTFSRSPTPCGYASPSSHASSPAKQRQPLNKKARIRQNRSAISDIFNGKLESSVQCLACGRVSASIEIFQDLSLSIPSQDALQVIRQETGDNQLNQSADGWFSWAWNGIWGWPNGIDVTLSECLAAFFSTDELKGDNMYSCEKCKKLRDGLKYSKVLQLPDTLTIHLKRFGHGFSLSSKINTKVSFPLDDLDMSPWLHPNCRSQQTRYHLTGVMCHHGMAGGGHYTSYALVDNSWYELDDSLVRPVDAATVARAEAYVLFYRKNSAGMELLRGKVMDLAKEDSHSSGELYISNEWLVKFLNMAEPGPIDNSSVICRHGDVLPCRVRTVQRLCTVVRSAVWQTLYDEFGGCVAVNRLQRCDICYAEEKEQLEKKQLEEFKADAEQERALEADKFQKEAMNHKENGEVLPINNNDAESKGARDEMQYD